jgi:UDP-N-acetylglucosamine 2-epimerase (non-hydrolysing)
MKVLAIFGTHPEVILMTPSVLELKKHAPRIMTRICVTTQFPEMPDRLLELFSIRPDFDLGAT